ncbi:LCP family protein [Bacillus sp. CGMCC 1.16541]|uniref:LCP family glycopolymer transferase n=1 Tax=Bacillus sp. CGMCC 1.16541 TaxID=2185143 RepID=UPI000D72525D|nr:LCP family protein [Bacillus sp. CGMCC 1.16541]
MGVLLFGAGSYTIYLWNTATATFANIQEDLNREKSEKRLQKISLNDGDPFSVLLMGVDNPEVHQNHGRADTLVLLTVNPEKKSIQMVSIPRDTRTKIQGKFMKEKINHSHAIGGTEGTIGTVEKFLDVPIDYFIKVNMNSFQDIVDAVGGVDVNNKLDFTFYDIHYPKGKLHLNGEEALGYARMRHLDPQGDFGRQKRQREVIEAVLEEGASISSLAKFGDLFKVVENNVKTNLTFDDMWTIQSNYTEALNNIEQHSVKGEGKKIRGTFYHVPNKDELQHLSNELKAHLEMKE